MMIMFFIFTGLVHLSLSDAIAPLLQNLPQTLTLEEEIQQEEKGAAERARERAIARAAEEAAGVGGAANSYYDTEQAFGEEEDMNSDGRYEDDDDDEEHTDDDDTPTATNNRAIEGASGIKSALTEWLKMSTKSKVKAEADKSGLGETLAKLRFWRGDKHGHTPPGFLARWLHPEEYEDFLALRRLIPPDGQPNIAYPDEYYGKYCDYLPPEVWMTKPMLWIPRDEARVSRQEVSHTSKYTPISDRGASLDSKGRVVVHFEQAPFEAPRLIL